MRVTQYFSNSTTHTTRPPVVSGIAICIGGGGHGAGVTGNGSAGGGGAGGQYCIGTLTLTGSTGYAVVAGNGKAQSTNTRVDGNDSTFATTVVVAKGGLGAEPVLTSGTAGAGAAGSATGGVGDILVAAGGSGANAASSGSSGGGGGAGGGDASSTTGGVTPWPPPAANGANGRTNGGNGLGSSLDYGSGGGGAEANNNTDRFSGIGGAGAVLVFELDQRDLLCLGCG